MESECECESYREQVSERERQRSIYMAADFVNNVGRVNHLRAAGPINRSEPCRIWGGNSGNPSSKRRRAQNRIPRGSALLTCFKRSGEQAAPDSVHGNVGASIIGIRFGGYSTVTITRNPPNPHSNH